MRTIHKIPLHMVRVQHYHLGGEKPRPLSVALQHGTPCLWFEIERHSAPVPTASKTAPSGKSQVTICLIATGDELPEGLTNFLGTLLLDGGNLVLHAYWAP